MTVIRMAVLFLGKALAAALAVAVVAGCTRAPIPLHLLQANIGTALLSCDPYVFKLCDVASEAAIAAAIAELDPDVIALQEVLPDTVCDAIDAAGGEQNAARSCHADARAAEASQLRRLLPRDAWDVACDDRNGFECVAARVGRATLAGPYQTAPSVADVDSCDDGFSVGRIDVVVGERLVRIVNGHPQSTKDTCRKAQVGQIFDTLAVDDDTDDGDNVDAIIVSGDMNLDPFSLGLDEDDASVPVWSAHVGEEGDGLPFVYASGPAEHAPAFPTTNTFIPLTLDHVAVHGASGGCVTLGGAEGSARLDGDAGSMDHRALDCALTIE